METTQIESINTFRVIVNQLDELRKLSGNAQISYLSCIKSDLLKEILEYTYDTHRKYKIDEGKYNKLDNITHWNRCEFDIDDWNCFKGILDNLNSIKSAKDTDVKKVVEFISDYLFEYEEFLKMILFKDLRLNMSIKKFQKVWSDFCVEPQVQLAQPKDNREEFLNPYYSRKFDGKRVWIKDNIPYSRSNKECSIPPMEHILEQLKQLNVKDYVLDGECLYFENGKEDFQKGISLCQKDKRTDGCENICYVIFDMISKDKFMSKQPYIPFKDEYFNLLSLSDSTKQSPCYSLIPTRVDNIFIARQDRDISKLSKLCKENNWEGIMCRDGDSCYEYKRTNKLLKIKQMHDTEVKLVSMEEGTGKYENMLGAFHADYNGFDLKIGSGFTDEQRKEYWNNRDKYIGNYVKVQYFEETVNQQGEQSLRFPIFLCFRDKETNEEFLY